VRWIKNLFFKTIIELKGKMVKIPLLGEKRGVTFFCFWDNVFMVT